MANPQTEPLPADAESRITEFTELVGTAISDVQARSEVERLAEEQAGLRRVATLVAREAPPEQVLARVAEEVGLLLQADAAWVWRLESHRLQVEVCDDGVGGAQADGIGLVGLKDRLAALDGTLRVESPADGDTLIAAFIPVR